MNEVSYLLKTMKDLKSQEKLFSVISFLRFLASQNEVLLYVINRELIYFHDGNDEKIAKTLVLATTQAESKILSEMYNRLFNFFLSSQIVFSSLPQTISSYLRRLLLFLDLLQEPWFKEAFLPIYIDVYPDLRSHVLTDNNHLETIYKLSPQLFSLPSLILPLCKKTNFKENLVYILINNLIELFDALCLEDSQLFDQKRKMLNPNQTFIEKHNYYAFSNDLTSLMVSQDIANWILEHSQECVAHFFKMMEMFEFMNYTTRQEHVHGELLLCSYLIANP